VGLRRRAVELPSPAQEIAAQAWLEIERTLGIPHPPQTKLHHAGTGQRNDMAWDEHASIDERATAAVRASPLEKRDTMPLARTIIGDAKPNNSAADDEHMFAHTRWLRPQHNGSASSKISVDSPVM